MSSKYFEVTEIITDTQAYDNLILRVCDVLERIEKTGKPWATVNYLRHALDYHGGGGWFNSMLEIGIERGMFFGVRCGHRIFVTSNRETQFIDVGDAIPDWIIRE